MHANVDAMARIGLLYLRHGRWQDQQLIPKSFVQLASKCVDQVVPLPEHVSEHGNASAHYGLLWWNNADGTIPLVPKNTFWSWGLYDSLIVVMPEHQIVVARSRKVLASRRRLAALRSAGTVTSIDFRGRELNRDFVGGDKWRDAGQPRCSLSSKPGHCQYQVGCCDVGLSISPQLLPVWPELRRRLEAVSMVSNPAGK